MARYPESGASLSDTRPAEPVAELLREIGVAVVDGADELVVLHAAGGHGVGDDASGTAESACRSTRAEILEPRGDRLARGIELRGEILQSGGGGLQIRGLLQGHKRVLHASRFVDQIREHVHTNEQQVEVFVLAAEGGHLLSHRLSAVSET